MPIDLVTEAEAAQMLGWHRKKLQRFRLDGNLAYIPGRPVVVERSDILDLIASERARLAHKFQGPMTREEHAKDIERKAQEFVRHLRIKRAMREPLPRR